MTIEIKTCVFLPNEKQLNYLKNEYDRISEIEHEGSKCQLCYKYSIIDNTIENRLDTKKKKEIIDAVSTMLDNLSNEIGHRNIEIHLDCK